MIAALLFVLAADPHVIIETSAGEIELVIMAQKAT